MKIKNKLILLVIILLASFNSYGWFLGNYMQPVGEAVTVSNTRDINAVAISDKFTLTSGGRWDLYSNNVIGYQAKGELTIEQNSSWNLLSDTYGYIEMRIADSILNVTSGSSLNVALYISDEKATTSIVNIMGKGTTAVINDYVSVSNLNITDGAYFSASSIEAKSLNVSDDASVNAIISVKATREYLFNVQSIIGLTSLNVGFDVRHNGNDLFGKSVDVFKEGSSIIAYNIAGENGYYRDGDVYLSYTDEAGKITIGNTIMVSNEFLGGTQVTISKDTTSGNITLTTADDKTEVGLSNMEQTVTTIDASNAKLVISDNAVVKTTDVVSGSKISVANNGTLNANNLTDNSVIEVADGAIVNITNSMSENSSVVVKGGTLNLGIPDSTTFAGTGVSNAQIQASSGVVSTSTSTLQLVDAVSVESGKSLEIKSKVEVLSSQSIFAVGENTLLKLQNAVNVKGEGTTFVLAGNVSGGANFIGDTSASVKQTIAFKGTYSPGNSPAKVQFTDINVNFEGVTDGSSASVLKLEVFGTGNVGGSDFDAVQLSNANMDFSDSGKIEIFVDAQASTNFEEGTFEFKFFELTGNSSITGLEAGDVTIVLSSMVSSDWLVTFSADESTVLTNTDTLNKLMQTGTVSLTFTAVPEPSTYAVIFGVLAIGFVMYRRRR